MSDEFEIRGGGAIAVDTDTLRATAARFVASVVELDDIARRLGSLHNMLFVERSVADEAVSAASVLSTRLAAVSADGSGIADSLREAAAIYELVELDAARAVAVARGDDADVRRIDAERMRIAHDHPGAAEAARAAAFERAVMWPSDLVRDRTEAGMELGGLLEFLEPLGPLGRRLADIGGIGGGAAFGLATILGAAVMGGGGWMRLPRDARLAPGSDAARITRLGAAGPTTAPTGLAGAAARMPRGDARVRVEKYVMPDGAAQYAVYVSGTRTLTPGGAEAWDPASIEDLVAGRESASYQATVQALEAAGARPGDVVHAVGHSQGAMITSRLALEGDYDVQTLVSLGSPVDADVGDGTLAVSIRHTDDAVPAFAGGGYNGAVGAPGSIVVERSTHDPEGTGDGPGPHALVSYTETARMVDRSSDPRVDQVRAVFAELDTATRVEVTEYGAQRLAVSSTSAAGAGGSRRPS